MKYFKIILINILVLISLLIIGELVMRIFLPDIWLYKRTYPNEFEDRAFDNFYKKVNWPKKDNDLGWVCKQDSFLKFSNPHYNKLPIVYNINKEGFRNRNDFKSLPVSKDKKRLLLLGDSFIMSVYISEDKTITSNLQNRLKESYQVFNMGIPGYGIDQSIMAYEKYSEFIQPNIVVLFYIDEDIPRILQAFRKVEGMNKPSYDIVNDTLKLRTKNNKSFITNLCQHSFVLNRLYKKYMDNYSIELAKKLFHKLIIKTQTRKQKLIVIRCPIFQSLLTKNSNQFYSFSDFFKKEQIEYYELYEGMASLPENYLSALYLFNEGHPSEIGARFFSDIIYGIILKPYLTQGNNLSLPLFEEVVDNRTEENVRELLKKIEE